MKTVRVFDFDSKKVSTIPQAELGTGMAHIEVLGIGHVWADLNQVSDKRPPYRHPPFDSGLRKLLQEKIMIPLKEVRPLNLDQWEDGFRRDINAEKEIALWIIIAERYTAFTKANPLIKPERHEVFRLVLHCTMVPNESAFWATADIQWLKRKQVEAVIAPFTINWREEGQ